jgi:hypothetical protein
MTIAILTAFALGIVLPHAMRLDSARPLAAVALWLTSLSLRLALVVFAALWALLILPTLGLYRDLTHWCVHVAVSAISAHADLHGHFVGELATWLPLAAVGIALTAAIARLVRAVLSVDRSVAGARIGVGPHDSVIVGGPEVLLAATGFGHPRVVVSAGALAALEDDELAAGLAHECGHIARRHHFLLAYAHCCYAAGRLIPSTRDALAELQFHVERDADEWALRRNHDPQALASAICKVAALSQGSTPAMTGLGGGGALRRLDRLVALEGRSGKPRHRRVADYAAVLLCGLALSSVIAGPAEAIGEDRGAVPPHGDHRCVS